MIREISASDYKIEIGSLVESSFEKYITTEFSKSKIVIICDENTHDFCLEYLLTNFEFLVDAEVMLLPAGEENKVLEVCFQVWEAMTEYGVGRNDLVINLGGGVVTDMGGFISSLYKRGVAFIHLPTTLLGMVDASQGGKTGIDIGAYKNQLGVFSNPKKVYIDPLFLETLENREIVNGFAEIIKHALIQDVELWNELEQLETLEEIQTVDFIYRAVEIKNNIVLQDPIEKGLRKILNYGHTVGHGIEGYFLDKDAIDHGHAVALGMLVEAYISLKRNKLDKLEFERIESVIIAWFPLILIHIEDIPHIIDIMHNDKKNHSNKIQCCLLEKIGECSFDNAVSEHEFSDALIYLVTKNVSLN